jgi:hypothetical protein
LSKEVRERDFSVSAIRCARAALPAASALGPDDIVAAALLEKAKAGAVVSTGHGLTVLRSRNCSRAFDGTILLDTPSLTWAIRPLFISWRTVD